MKAAVMGDDKIMPLILMNVAVVIRGGSVAEWLACRRVRSRSRDAVG